MAESADVNAVVGADGKFRYVSRACERMFGWDPDDIEGRFEEEFVHPADLASLEGARQQHTEGQFNSPAFRFLCADDTYRWVETTVRSVKSDNSTFVVTIRDITEQHQRTAGLEQQALTDPLTGLANRTLLRDRLAQSMRRLSRHGGIVAVLYIDIDRFKSINDTLGHASGDELISQFGRRLAEQVRPSDTVARFGGDEFVVVAEGLSDESAAFEIASRVAEDSRVPFSLGTEERCCTVSIGIACTSDGRRPPDDLLSEADLALYQAKRRGRDRVEAFDDELRERVSVRVAIGQTLQRCKDEELLVFEYQPILDLEAETVVGAEGFLRVKDPDHGLLEPDAFLKVAEEIGMLSTLEEQLLTDAVRQAAAWRMRVAETGLLEVAVNISSRGLSSDYPTTVLGLLDRHILAPGHLLLEISEKTLLEASDTTLSELRVLSEAGVQIGLDNFGTGYSPLGYLREFPFDFVKIDRSFIAEVDRAEDLREVVAAFIRLAHALHMTVVAEGVSSQSQVEILGELKCDRVQGPLFGAPGPPQAIEEAARRALLASPSYSQRSG